MHSSKFDPFSKVNIGRDCGMFHLDRLHNALVGRRAYAKVQRNGLSNALGRKTRHRHQCDEPHHTKGKPRIDGGLFVRGAEERLAPILMTVLAAGLSLLPLVISGKLPGQEIEYPMAWVILLGLTSATLVNLFVLPVGCAMFLKQIPASESESEALAPG